ncbi:MAG: hypothetical protein AAFX87_24745 [Bacteroidota bacterium]
MCGKSIIFSAILIFSASLSKAQLPAASDWQKGVLVTQKGDSIFGKIHFDKVKSLILISNPSTFRCFTPYAVHSFFYYRKDGEGFKRSFYTYKESEDHPDRKTRVHEQISIRKKAEGKLTAHKPSEADNFNIRINHFKWGKYYYLWHRGKVERIKNFKQQFLSMRPDYEVAIDDFVRLQNLAYTDPSDQARIVAMVNRLEESKWLASR